MDIITHIINVRVMGIIRMFIASANNEKKQVLTVEIDIMKMFL